MDSTEFSRSVEALRSYGVNVEEWLEVEAGLLEAWARGDARIPRLRVRQVKWLLQFQENQNRLESAALPTCEWLTEHQARFDQSVSLRGRATTEDLEAFANTVQAHFKECNTCSANAAWDKNNLGRIGAFPSPGLGGLILAVFGSIPRNLWPAALGAAFLGAIVTLRIVFATPLLLAHARNLKDVLSILALGFAAIVAASVAGAAGGLAVPVVRPVFRRLGAIGDYLTGIVVVEAYAWAFVPLAPIAFGESLLTSPSDWIFIAGYAAVLGLFGGYVYRRQQSKARTASAV